MSIAAGMEDVMERQVSAYVTVDGWIPHAAQRVRNSHTAEMDPETLEKNATMETLGLATAARMTATENVGTSAIFVPVATSVRQYAMMDCVPVRRSVTMAMVLVAMDAVQHA